MPRPVDPKPEPRKTSTGTSWRVRFRHRGRQTSETFRTNRAAQDFADDIRRHGVETAMRLYEDRLRAREGDTLDELFEDFLTWKATRVRSDRTVVDYRRTWQRWMSPTLGVLPAHLVTEKDVQKWIDSMIGSPKSIADRHALLHAVYKWAAKPAVRRVEIDPCTSSDLPKGEKKMPKGLQPTEYQALYAAMYEIDRDAADLIDFLAASGWRWSEATALAFGQVDEYGGVMYVSAGWVMRRGATGTADRVESVKGEGSLRRIKLDQDAAAVIRRRAIGKKPGDLVFTTSEGYGWHYNNFRRRKWDRAVKAAGLEYRSPTPHWLRHTAVAWAVMSGASLKEIQARIGHKNISTTMDTYGRMIDDISTESVDKIGALRTGRVVAGQIES